MLNTSLQILGTEWIWLVFLVIFLLFGSQKLPELSRALGKAMGEFQRGREEIEREIRAASMTSYTPPKVEPRNPTGPASTVPPISSTPAPAPVLTTPVTTVTTAPEPTVTSSTITQTATPEKSESPSRNPSKKPRTTKTKRKADNEAKTSRRRKKKDNSAAK
jgi:TatA/E family protein of Tat protein translocase